MATDRDQAAIAFNYVRGLFGAVPLLSGLVERVTADTIDLATGASITIATCSYRGSRGRTVCLAIYDELAFWRSDEYATPDVEVAQGWRAGRDR